MKFGDYLKMLRIRKNLSLRDLADKVNLSFSYLCDIENNRKSAPNDKSLLLLANVLCLNNYERDAFFDKAAETKKMVDENNFHLPADIGQYIVFNDRVKTNLRNIIKKDSQNHK